MIIFYNKTTGEIVSVIDGRIHPSEHLNIWVGDKENFDRIIVNWQHIGEGNFEPDTSQKEEFILFEKQSQKIYEYIIDLKTKQLIKKT
jgi:hypothetical protein